MSKIDVLAVLVTASDKPAQVIKTKAGLKNLILTSADLVTFVPVPVASDPAHEAVRGIATFIPAGTVVTAHSPTGRKWTAEISRTESNVFTVK